MDKSKREQRLEKKRQEKRKAQMRSAGIVAVIAIVLVGLFIVAGQLQKPHLDHTYTKKAGNVLGDEGVSVLVVEYGDFQCSHCRDFYNETESKLISTYVDTGMVAYEFRPLEFLGPDSGTAAQAALCAGDQNYFWEYHSLLFSNYSNGFSKSRLLTLGEALDMDQGQFASCLDSGEKDAIVQTFGSQAAAAGVSGTPSFTVNGTLLQGNVPFEQLSTAIETALGQ